MRRSYNANSSRSVHGYSRTAEYMALFRALESARRSHVRLFTDRWARDFLRPSYAAAVALARFQPIHSAICWYIDRRWPGARPAAVARTRYIDDLLADAVRNGMSQAVILGAGFDMRAYRIDGIAMCRVVEIDRHETSELKRTFVRRSFRSMPGNVTHVAADFNDQNIGDVLQESGLRMELPIFFLWEGVTNYLNEESVDRTLRLIATATTGSRVLFTYVDRDVLGSDSQFHHTRRVRDRLSRVDEPWTFGFGPPLLSQYLDVRGFRLLSDVDSVSLRSKYMGATGSHLRGYEFYRVALAEVIRVTNHHGGVHSERSMG